MDQSRESVQCGEQLLAILVGDPMESATWKEIHKGTLKLANNRQKQEKQLKETIQFLTNEINLLPEEASHPAQDLAHMETLLVDQVNATHSQSAAVAKECEQVKGELTKLQREQQAMKDQQLSQEKQIAALPLARCDINLYSNITNLRWQFNCGPQEVRGYVCNNNDIKTFSLNSQEVSRFFITNHLWDLIEEDW